MKKTPKRSKVVNELDKYFSIFIRRRGSDINGFNECFTCGKYELWSKLQCGHFQSRGKYATRWDEVNCQPQCVGCNMFKQGEQFKFALKLNEKYGENTAELLMLLANKTVKFSTPELIDKIEYYVEKIKLWEQENK